MGYMLKPKVGDIIKVRMDSGDYVGRVVEIYSGMENAYLLEYEGEWLFDKSELVIHDYQLKSDKAYFWAWRDHVIGTAIADTEIARKIYPDAMEYEGKLIVC